MRRFLVAIACVAPGPLSQAYAQAAPPARSDSLGRGPEVRTEYDELTDSTTRRLSEYMIA